MGKKAALCSAKGRMWRVGYRRLGSGAARTCKMQGNGHTKTRRDVILYRRVLVEVHQLVPPGSVSCVENLPSQTNGY